VAPIWFAKTTASTPNNVVVLEAAAQNLLIGSSININAPSDTQLIQTVPATAFLLQGGKTANAQASIPLAVAGDTLSASNWNFINISFERDGALAEDTFGDSIFLLGIGVQWAVNFNNITVWPT
jgi:hypothetical protein